MLAHLAVADCVDRYHSTVFASPSSKLTLGAYPSRRLALEMSACESRTSPARDGPYFGSTFAFTNVRTAANSSFSDTRPDVATLITSPLTPGATAARNTPSTMLAT